MEKGFSSMVGLGLILLGALALVVNLAVPAVGPTLLGWILGQIWPLIVLGLGWVLVLLPLMVRGRRGLGGLFIPGVPVLFTGGILFLTNFLGWWNLWEWLWPLEVLGVALGFLLAAVYLRVIWLLIPAIIIGANGLVFQFCAVTGLWEMWSVLWTIEPLAIGVALLVVGFIKQSNGLRRAGLILIALAALSFIVMITILAATMAWPWLWLMLPLLLIVLGGTILGFNALQHVVRPKFY